jgi:hypothetical protein
MKLRFTIRDLLWAMALTAVLLAWWIDHRNLTKTPPFTLQLANKSFSIHSTKTGAIFIATPSEDWLDSEK